MASLPQELIEEIINYLDPGDKESLRSCSLVATPWVYPSQKRLFKSVTTRPADLQTWLDRVSQKNSALLGHVRHLTCNGELLCTARPIKPAHSSSLHGQLPPLRQLEHFDLKSTTFKLSLQEIELFSAFKLTLTSITLSYCYMSESLLVALINYFPKLDCLCLKRLTCPVSHDQTSLLPRRPLEKLLIDDGLGKYPNLLEELSKMRFDEVALQTGSEYVRDCSFADRVVRALGAGIKCLRISQISGHIGYLTLSPCHELRELELETWDYPPNFRELNTISSIISTNVEKIIIKHWKAFCYLPCDVFWTSLDHILTELVGRPGYKFRLEVEFREYYGVEGSKFDQKGTHLPRFVEKGRMTVWNCEGELVYCSDAPGVR